MDMGVVKPFEPSRTTATAAPAEAGVSGRPVSRQAELARLDMAQTPVDVLSTQAVEQPAAVDREALQSAVEDMQSFVQSVSRDINFQVDDETGRTVVNVTERTSGEVIRQIPSEEALRLAENLSEIRSLLFKAEA